MTTIRRITTVALVGTVAGALAATSIGRPQQGGSTTLPFTFQADTPARADEVNQNFQVLDDRTRSLPGGNLQAETITQREIDDFSLRGPDISASGGDVSIFPDRDFFVEVAAGLQPFVALDGDATTANNSFRVATGAIGAGEILDEPGLASEFSFGAGAGGTAVETIIQRSMTAPANGFVLVMASGSLTLSTTDGTDPFCTIGFSDSGNNGTLPPGSVFCGGLDGLPVYTVPFTYHQVFPVLAGETKAYSMLASAGVAAHRVDVQLPRLTTLFIPTSYGSVTQNAINATMAPGTEPMHGPLTYAEIEAEKEAERIRHAEELERVRAEMAEIRQELRSLRGPAHGAAGHDG